MICHIFRRCKFIFSSQQIVIDLHRTFNERRFWFFFFFSICPLKSMDLFHYYWNVFLTKRVEHIFCKRSKSFIFDDLVLLQLNFLFCDKARDVCIFLLLGSTPGGQATCFCSDLIGRIISWTVLSSFLRNARKNICPKSWYLGARHFLFLMSTMFRWEHVDFRCGYIHVFYLQRTFDIEERSAGSSDREELDAESWLREGFDTPKG